MFADNMIQVPRVGLGQLGLTSAYIESRETGSLFVQSQFCMLGFCYSRALSLGDRHRLLLPVSQGSSSQVAGTSFRAAGCWF